VPRRRALLRCAAGLLLLASPLAAAGDPFAACEARIAADPESWASGCFHRLARRHGLWAEAERRLAAHLAERPDNPYLTFYLASVEMDHGRLQRALERFATAAARFARRREPLGEAYAWLNRGECRQLLGDLEGMGSELKRAEAAARAAADPDLLASVRISRARLLRRQGGDLTEVRRLLAGIESEIGSAAPYGVWRSLLFEKAAALVALSRHEEALETSRRWAALARSAGNAFDEARARTLLAVAFSDLAPRPGSRAEAIRLASQAQELAQRAGNPSAEAKARELLGKLLPPSEGRVHLQRCLELAAATGEPLQECACRFALAGLLSREDPAAARAELDRALALALAGQDPWPLAYGWAERFRVVWATRERREAVADSLAVLDLIEALRRLQDDAEGRAGFFSDWTGPYYALAGRLLGDPPEDGSGEPSREDLETAFFAAERLRARVLLDGLLAARAAPRPPDGDGQGAARTATLRQIVGVQRRLQDPALQPGERRALVEDLAGLEDDLARFDGTRHDPERLDGPPRRAASLLPAGGFSTLADAEESLAPDEALLSFLVGRDEDLFGKPAGGSWLIVSTADGSRAYPLPGRSALETQVEIVLGLVAARNDFELAAAASSLYNRLLAEPLADLPRAIDKLVIVPDGVLHLLPFGLLRPHPQADPLAARFRLSLAPSATLFVRWRRQPRVATGLGALALADPAFLGGGDRRGEGADEAEDRLWALESGARLGRLPYARREGRAVVRYLGGPPSRLVVGEDASEEFLKGAPLGRYGLLHFAAHALLDDRRPARSAILLAAGGPAEDGLLQPREIATLDLEGKLVVLSACRSASGKLLLGEGVQSLARAFFQAGARTVVGSLWRLRDDDGAAFFDQFYRFLGQGRSVAAALAEAQEARRRAGAPAAAWAGVVVLGDGDLVPLPGGVEPTARARRLALLAASVLLLLAFAALAARELRRRRRSAP
jgi:CHAT domain-containing protein/tetratricopeptide (TPR) repeat protein